MARLLLLFIKIHFASFTLLAWKHFVVQGFLSQRRSYASFQSSSRTVGAISSTSKSFLSPLEGDTKISIDTMKTGELYRTSLAGPFLVQCSVKLTSGAAGTENDGISPRVCTFTLCELETLLNIDESTFATSSARSWAAIMQLNGVTTMTDRDDGNVVSSSSSSRRSLSQIELQAIVRRSSKEHIVVEITAEVSSERTTILEKHGDLVSVLVRILAQWAASENEFTNTQEAEKTTVSITFDNNQQKSQKHESKETFDFPFNRLIDLSDHDVIHELFHPLISSPSEIVEMVDQYGRILGRIPRKLVHQHNILHRGIGMFVTANRPILSSSQQHETQQQQQQPDLYVHRRTDTKRIFPSLYDMFVGGVSLAGEAAVVTAEREVAEELGLMEPDHLLPDPLLQCVVCTDYNRCVVSLFSYTANTPMETVKWQAEEVAWGEFVPYAVIEAAGDLSIQRLVKQGSWPGQLPAIKSKQKGSIPPDSPYNKYIDKNEDGGNWKEWDFVPDGLLVWDAWLRCQEETLA